MAAFGRLGALDRGFGRLGGGSGRGQTVIPGVITANRGSKNITGIDANLIVARLPLIAAVGSKSITGIDATLTYSGSGGGSSGQPMGLLLSLTYA